MVEDKMLSAGGRDLILRISKFIGSLMIKVPSEIEKYETKESALQYALYRNAREKIDDFGDYIYTESFLLSTGMFAHRVAAFINYTMDINDHLKDTDVNKALEILRQKRIDNYVDKNYIIRYSMGHPPEGGRTVYVELKDEIYDQYGMLVTRYPVHLISEVDHPLTFDKVFMKRLIDTMINDNPDLKYLKCIEEPIDPYLFRECEPYQILRYDSTHLNSSELERFFEVYESVRERLMFTKYVEGFDKRFNAYGFVFLHVLLYAVTGKFINSYLKAYSVQDYTDVDIYNILDSYNLPGLKTVKMKTLRKIVPYLDTFISKKGIEQVLLDILGIIAGDSTTVRRYNLVKSYNIDNNNEIDLNLDAPYDESVKLVFTDEEISTDGTIKSVGNTKIDYDDMVRSDELWGGVKKIPVTEFDTREAYRESLMKKLLHHNFDKLRTKYLVVNSIIEANSPYLRFIDLLGLEIQTNGVDSFVFNKKYSVLNLNATLFDMYMGVCYLRGYNKGLDDYDRISGSIRTLIGACRYIQDSALVTRTKMDEITLDTPYNGTCSIKQILLNANLDVADFVISLNTLEGASLNYIDSLYITNIKPVLDRIDEKLASTDSIDVKMAMDYLYNYNRKDVSFDIGIGPYEELSSYLKFRSPNLYDYIDAKMIVGDSDNLREIESELLTAFRTNLSEETGGVVEMATGNEATFLEDMQDLKILMSEFTSLFSELYKVEIINDLSNYPFNSIKLRHTFSETSGYNYSQRLRVQENYYTTIKHENKEKINNLKDLLYHLNKNDNIDIIQLSDDINTNDIGRINDILRLLNEHYDVSIDDLKKFLLEEDSFGLQYQIEIK